MTRESKTYLLVGALAAGALLALLISLCAEYPAPLSKERCPGGICTPPGGVKPAEPGKPSIDLPEWFPQVDKTKIAAAPPQHQLDSLRVKEQAPGEAPVVDLPEAMRTKNYKGGSCVHASTINLLKWQGLDELAQWWRENHAYGESAGPLASKMEKAGLKFAYVTNGDPAFIEWAIRTRRGAGIGYKPRHAINIVGLTQTHAILLDNNATHRYEYVPREEFFRKWRSQFGGWAWAVIYEPPAPRPVA